MTVVGKCDSHQGDVKSIKKVCQLMERCDDYGETVTKCYSYYQVGVKGIKKVCQVLEKCDGHWGM